MNIGIVEKGGQYLDSHGRRFVFGGFGKLTGLAMGWAYDPRPKRPRRRAAGYDQFGDSFAGISAALICPYPANDWYPVAFVSYAACSATPALKPQQNDSK